MRVIRRIYKSIYKISVIIALLNLLTVSLPVMANSLLIWPIYPTIESDQQASALQLENRGSETVNMQLRIFSWSQGGGEDHYQPQQAMVGSPPMMAIAPGERQLVRLIRQAPVPANQEQAYRIIIDEIPALADQSGANNGAPRAAVRLQMRYSLPLFVYGKGASLSERLPSNTFYPGLSWRVVDQQGQAQLEIRNTGNHHVRLSQVAFEQSGQRAQVTAGLLGYVLPGQMQRWPLPQGLQPTGELHAQVSGSTHRISPQ